MNRTLVTKCWETPYQAAIEDLEAEPLEEMRTKPRTIIANLPEFGFFENQTFQIQLDGLQARKDDIGNEDDLICIELQEFENLLKDCKTMLLRWISTDTRISNALDYALGAQGEIAADMPAAQPALPTHEGFLPAPRAPMREVLDVALEPHRSCLQLLLLLLLSSLGLRTHQPLRPPILVGIRNTSSMKCGEEADTVVHQAAQGENKIT